jgi:hypothetical protein
MDKHTIDPPPPLMLIMLPPDIAQQLYELMVKSDSALERDLATIRRKYARRQAVNRASA